MKKITLILIIIMFPSLIHSQSRYHQAHRSVLHKMKAKEAQDAFPLKAPAAPDPTDNQDDFDVHHYILDIAFNDSTSHVDGTVTISLTSLVPGLPTVDINAL